MNKKELYKLLGGTGLLTMLIFGSMGLINAMQASDLGQLGYAVDIYSDHYHGEPTWPTLAGMNHPRDGHTATVLQDGRILVVGGTGPASLTEAYNPTTNTWAYVADPIYARNDHAAVLLPDGRVFVAGGGNVIAEIYNPTTNDWTQTAPKSADSDYDKSAAVLLQDGRVLVVSSNDPEIYDPNTNSWSAAGTHVGGNRSYPVITLLNDGNVLLSGSGSNLPGDDNAELYNVKANQWTVVSDMNHGRKYHTSTLLQDGRVLVTSGGSSAPNAEIYNPANDTWIPTSEWIVTDDDPAKAYRRYHTAVLMDDGRVLVAGGGSTANAKIYDPITDSWTSTTALTTNRQKHEMVKLQNGDVIVLGGTNGEHVAMESVEIYNDEPAVAIDHDTGKPDSYFTISLYDFPANNTLSISANGKSLGNGSVSNNGSFFFQIDTSGAPAGNYTIIIISSSGDTDGPLGILGSVQDDEEYVVNFTIDDNAGGPWPKNNALSAYPLPANIGLDEEIYLPMTIKSD